MALWEVFTEEDATLVEVNPDRKTPDGVVLALDGRQRLDENAGFRQPGHAALVDAEADNPLEARAKEAHLNYVKLDGQVDRFDQLLGVESGRGQSPSPINPSAWRESTTDGNAEYRVSNRWPR